jgi:predicted nuclease of predicted toxin-antitoxin system
VRFFVDANLSPHVTRLFTAAGHHAAAVRDFGLQDAPGDGILDRALIDDRVIISHDTDFGTLLAVRGQSKPSFVVVRSADPLTADQVARLIIDNLDVMAEDVAAGAIATFARGHLRSWTPATLITGDSGRGGSRYPDALLGCLAHRRIDRGERPGDHHLAAVWGRPPLAAQSPKALVDACSCSVIDDVGRNSLERGVELGRSGFGAQQRWTGPASRSATMMSSPRRPMPPRPAPAATDPQSPCPSSSSASTARWAKSWLRKLRESSSARSIEPSSRITATVWRASDSLVNLTSMTVNVRVAAARRAPSVGPLAMG